MPPSLPAGGKSDGSRPSTMIAANAKVYIHEIHGIPERYPVKGNFKPLEGERFSFG